MRPFDLWDGTVDGPVWMQNSTKKLMANGVRYISTGSRVFVHQSFAGQENLKALMVKEI